MSEPPPRPSMPSGVGTGRSSSREDEVPEGDGILVPPIFPSLLTTTDSSCSNSNTATRRSFLANRHRSLDRASAPRQASVPSSVGRSRSREAEVPEGDGILVPPIFPSLITSGTSDLNSNSARPSSQRESGAGRHRSLDRSSELVTGGSQEERARESSHHRHHRHHHRHHHHNHQSNSSSSGGNYDHTHHHRRHHHRERGEHGHERRARRYLANGSEGENMTFSNPNSLDLDLNFSLIALNQRLRALQLRRESEENGTVGGGESDDLLGGGGSVGRHRSRSHTHSHSHSHSRNQFNPSSLFFMAPSRRSKWSHFGPWKVLTN